MFVCYYYLFIFAFDSDVPPTLFQAALVAHEVRKQRRAALEAAKKPVVVHTHVLYFIFVD
jgi:hypothetical protein